MPTCGCYILFKTYHYVYHANACINLHILINTNIIYIYRQNPDSLILPGDRWVFPPRQVGTSASQQGDYFQVFVFQKDDLAQIYPEKITKGQGFRKNTCKFSQTPNMEAFQPTENNLQYAINRCSSNSGLFCWVLLISCVLFFPVLVPV